MSAVKVENSGRQTLVSETIGAATSRADVLSGLAFAARAFNFTFVTLVVKPIAQDDLLGRILVHTTLPSEYIQEYDQNRYLRACPMLEKLFSSMLPRTWTIDAVEREHTGILPVELPRLQRRFGITTTAAMPLHSLDGERFLLRFDGNRPSLDMPELNELGMIALHAFDVFEKFRRSERFAVPSPLSARELEVVRWTAQGKTSVEIGHILSLSDHTINAHMTNAIKKLDCVNRTQLVAKAIRLGLIS